MPLILMFFLALNQQSSIRDFMKIQMYQVDAFSKNLYSGNPAAVCLLDKWLKDELMQNIAAENNLAETAFVLKKGNTYEIRWFTPKVEVDLCGHATLASAHVLFEHEGFTGKSIEFKSKSGKLEVKKRDGLLVMNFPSDPPEAVYIPDILVEGVGQAPEFSYRTTSDYMLVYKSEKQIKKLKPDFLKILKVGMRGIIVTAPGDTHDFVSRFFAPQSGIDEDPVTGSAHTSLIPYWAERLEKEEMVARQLSKRGGILYLKTLGKRVEIGGHAITYLSGKIKVR